jgi:hypothetical protein
MASVQLRYPKLWYAGALKNWPLANYELARIKDGLEDATWFYGNIPVEAVMLIAKPLSDLGEAITAKDGGKFERTFLALTHACNECHGQAQLGFIVSKPPTTLLFSDQDFTPREK